MVENHERMVETSLFHTNSSKDSIHYFFKVLNMKKYKI